jgi:hypothetical protein
MLSEEEAVNALAATPRVLDQLVDNSLIEYFFPTGYAVHQTIRDYAALRRAQLEKK